MTRSILTFTLLATLGLPACGGKSTSNEVPVDNTSAVATTSSDTTSDAQPTCAERAEGIRTFLDAAMDQSQPVDIPWPTGDQRFDENIREVIAAVEAADPAERQTPIETKQEPEDLLFGECPQASSAMAAVGSAAPDKRGETLRGIADAIEACDCKVTDAAVKSMLYFNVRSMEASKQDRCLADDCWLPNR